MEYIFQKVQDNRPSFWPIKGRLLSKLYKDKFPELKLECLVLRIPPDETTLQCHTFAKEAIDTPSSSEDLLLQAYHPS
ncbi:hypothetical protein Leryth_018562 [Lithospermum erythrorhizon]|nr:hypothetical protein Leryth_018562 [Lithospermum erythrorhizon]